VAVVVEVVVGTGHCAQAAQNHCPHALCHPPSNVEQIVGWHISLTVLVVAVFVVPAVVVVVGWRQIGQDAQNNWPHASGKLNPGVPQTEVQHSGPVVFVEVVVAT